MAAAFFDVDVRADVGDDRGRHVDVLPARPRQPVAEIEVLEVHEVRLGRSRRRPRRRCAAAAGRRRTASRPAVRAAPRARAGRPRSTGWTATTSRPARGRCRARARAGPGPRGRSRPPACGSAGRTRPRRGQRAAASTSVSSAPGSQHDVRVGDDHELGRRRGAPRRWPRCRNPTLPPVRTTRTPGRSADPAGCRRRVRCRPARRRPGASTPGSASPGTGPAPRRSE